jgi:hypothetical protein
MVSAGVTIAPRRAHCNLPAEQASIGQRDVTLSALLRRQGVSKSLATPLRPTWPGSSAAARTRPQPGDGRRSAHICAEMPGTTWKDHLSPNVAISWNFLGAATVAATRGWQ